MKQLLFILSLFIVFAASAQNGKKYAAEFDNDVKYNRGAFPIALHIPVWKDTISIRDNSRWKDSAEIGLFQGELWYKAANGYLKKAGGNGNGNGGGINIIDSVLSNTDINIKWFNPNIGDSVTPAIDAFNAAKAVLALRGGGTIYFPAGKYTAADANGWLVGQSNIRLKGDGIGLTVLLPAAGQVNGGLQMATYRDAGWVTNTDSMYTFEDSAAIGQDYIIAKGGQDLSLLKAGSIIFINDGASYYDQYYGEFNTVAKVQGNRIYLADNLSRDYTSARGSWAGVLTQPFTMPAIGQSAVANIDLPPTNTGVRMSVSINNNLFNVVSVTGTTATLKNVGKGNAAAGTVLPTGAQVMRWRAIALTPSTAHDVTVENMTVIGRRKALTVSNSYNTHFNNVHFIILPTADNGQLSIDGDDGKYATLNGCRVSAAKYTPSQIARSFTGFKAINTTFHNTSVDLTEFATGEIAGCTFDEGREIDSIELFPGNPAITIGSSTANVYIHDNTIRVSNRIAAIGANPDIQVYYGQSGNAVTIDNNTIYCNNCISAIDAVRNGAFTISNNKVFGSLYYLFSVDGALYADTTNQRDLISNRFGYGNSCKISNNYFGGYINAISLRKWHNVAFTDNDINRFGIYGGGSGAGDGDGNIIKGLCSGNACDAFPIQRLMVAKNTFRHWNLQSNSFSVAAIDSLRMDISLNYFYDNVGTGAKDSIVTRFTPFDNRYKNTGGGNTASITGSQVTTALGFTPYNAANPGGFITSDALSPYELSTHAAGAYHPLENQRVSTTSLPQFTGVNILPQTNLSTPAAGFNLTDSTGAGATFIFPSGKRKSLNWSNVTGNGVWKFQNKSYTIADSADVAAHTIAIAAKINYVTVSTYAAMIALGTPAAATVVKVATDENKGQTNTIYQLWADGTRMWMAAVQDN